MYDDTCKLILWQKSHALVMKIYEITKDFPKYELFGLTSQLRRAAVSVPSNLVEGKARGTNKEYIRFLYISRGSLAEVKYQILLARDLEYIDMYKYESTLKLANEAGKILNGLINKLLVS